MTHPHRRRLVPLCLCLAVLVTAGCGGGGIPETDSTSPLLSLDANWPLLVRYQCSSDETCPAVPDLGARTRQEGIITVPLASYDELNSKLVTVTLVASDAGSISTIGMRLVFDADIVDAGGGVVMPGPPGSTLVVRSRDPADAFKVDSLQVVLRLLPGDSLVIYAWADDFGGTSGSPNRTDLDSIGFQIENG